MKWRWIGLVMLLGGLAVAIFFGRAVVWQDWAVRKFVPVEGVIYGSRIVSTSHQKGATTYEPVVHYLYWVAAVQYSSDQIVPYGDWGDYDQAKAMVDRFPVDKRVTVYVDGGAPEHAFLVRAYSGLPYICSVIGIWVGAIGVGLMLGLLGPRRRTMLAAEVGGWYLLVPGENVKQRRRDAVLAFLLTGIPTGILAGHLIVVAHPTTAMGWGIAALGVLAVIGEMVWLARVWSVSRHMSDPRVQISAAPIKLGEAVRIRAEFDAYAALRVKGMRAALVCTEFYQEMSGRKMSSGCRPAGDVAAELGAVGEVKAGEMASGEGEAVLARDKWTATGTMQTGSDGRGHYHYYVWELRLEVKLEGMVGFSGAFPVEVVG